MSEEFINLIRQYEVIYNTNCDEYRDSSVKNAAWKEIAKVQNMSVHECKNTWSKLRNCYNNAIKRRLRKRGPSDKKIAPWRYESQMSFLLPYLGGRDTAEYLLPEVDTLEFDTENMTTHDTTQDSSNSFAVPSPQSYLDETPTHSAMTSKNQFSDKYMFEMLHMMKTSQENRQLQYQMDDTDYFFLSMSNMLKKLPAIDQARIKMDLHRAIHEVELRQLEKQGDNVKMPI